MKVKQIRQRWIAVGLMMLAIMLSACGGNAAPAGSAPQLGAPLKVLAVESFLADIAQNVAGDRLQVATLMPLGLDPHAFEPTPQDIANVADANLLIVNGAGLEEWLQKVLDNAGGQRRIVEAAAGLASRAVPAGEGELEQEHTGGDPHFWLDPTKVIAYTDNIRDGLIAADPDGKDVYTANAAAYVTKLQALDRWIAGQIAQVPAGRRLLVTNHESFGYYADRYGLRVIGAVIPSVSSNASPSAQQMAHLVDMIRSSGAPAIFLEVGNSPQLAQQIAQETGARVVTDLYSHSITPPDGPAPTYLDMMRYNTQQIVDALK
jgi:ABC-type Zn uptake system ZnuABC Zn-binding protein ZnuA